VSGLKHVGDESRESVRSNVPLKDTIQKQFTTGLEIATEQTYLIRGKVPE
jgi:hypothetical protein